MKYTKEYLSPLIASSHSWRSLTFAVGIKPTPGSGGYLKKVAVKLNIDFSHFTGQAHNKNKTFSIVPIEEYLSNRKRISSNSLRLRLIKDGLKKEECELCHLSEWLGEKIVLELDHKNSNPTDNSFDNLQIICPNCHSLQTRNRLKELKLSKKKIDKRYYGQDRLNKRKIKNRPLLEEILTSVTSIGYCATGRHYGVSDNAIRKWIRRYKNALLLKQVASSVLETDVERRVGSNPT